MEYIKPACKAYIVEARAMMAASRDEEEEKVDFTFQTRTDDIWDDPCKRHLE